MAVITRSLISKGKTTRLPSTKTVKLTNATAASNFVAPSKFLAARKSGGQ
jgi:hypothetical protein